MDKVYLESTIPNYLASKESVLLTTLSKQASTREWWRKYSNKYELVVSEAVIDEIRMGNQTEAKKRLSFVSGAAVLVQNPKVLSLHAMYVKKFGLSRKEQVDIIHIAFAVAYGIDYLLTWNCKHINNPVIVEKMHLVNNRINEKSPLIMTPQAFLEIMKGE